MPPSRFVPRRPHLVAVARPARTSLRLPMHSLAPPASHRDGVLRSHRRQDGSYRKLAPRHTCSTTSSAYDSRRWNRRSTATHFRRGHDVPVCVNVRDLSPDVFRSVAARRSFDRWPVRALPAPRARQPRTCRTATSVVRRQRIIPRLGSATGPPLTASPRIVSSTFRPRSRPTASRTPTSNKFWIDHGVDPSKTLLAFVGTFDSRFDFCASVISGSLHRRHSASNIHTVLLCSAGAVLKYDGRRVIRPRSLAAIGSAGLCDGPQRFRPLMFAARLRGRPPENKIVDCLASRLPLVTTLRRHLTARSPDPARVQNTDTGRRPMRGGQRSPGSSTTTTSQHDMATKADAVFVRRFDAAEVYHQAPQ